MTRFGLYCAVHPYQRAHHVPRLPSSRAQVWHNYSFDRHVMEQLGLGMRGFGGDTMHMARLWDSSRMTRGGYSLEALSSECVVWVGVSYTIHHILGLAGCCLIACIAMHVSGRGWLAGWLAVLHAVEGGSGATRCMWGAPAAACWGPPCRRCA